MSSERSGNREPIRVEIISRLLANKLLLVFDIGDLCWLLLPVNGTDGLASGNAVGDGKGLRLGNGLAKGDGLGVGRASPTLLPWRDSSGLRRDRIVDSICLAILGDCCVRCFASSRFGSTADGGPDSGAAALAFPALPLFVGFGRPC